MRTRIFVTGATGFVGAAVVRQLIDSGHQVAVLVRPRSDRRRLSGLLNSVEVVEGDLSQPDGLAGELTRLSPSVVIHLAWQGVRNVDRDNPLQLQNVPAALNFYRHCVASGVQHFIGMGSQAEYGPHPGKIAECMSTNPTSLYGAAKLALRHLLGSLTSLDNVGFTWLRLFSSYGPGDDADWAIPYLIAQLMGGERPSLTKGEQMWDYIYIDDVGRAVVATVEKRPQGVFNLGSGTALALRDIFLIIRDMINPDLELGLGDIPYRRDQVMHLEADISLLQKATGWGPQTSIRAGLEKTVAWYRNAALRAAAPDRAASTQADPHPSGAERNHS